MSTQPLSYTEIVERLPNRCTLTMHGRNWEEYEALLEEVGEAAGLRISYNDGELRIMTLSTEHEFYVRLIERMVTATSLRRRIKTLHFGSATIKMRRLRKGSEPDACFYVQSADRLGNRIKLNFDSDPPPDLVVEIDVHHESLTKFPIYAAFGVSEIWRYGGEALTIYHLEQDEYVTAAASLAFPMLPSQVLTDFLNRSQREDQHEILVTFENWLQSLTQ
jgi:Uma2 family endonuclease